MNTINLETATTASKSTSSLLSGLADRLRKIAKWFVTHRGARWGLYASVFFFFYLFFAYLTFPYDRLKDLLIEKVESGELGLRNAQLDIEELRPSFLTGVRLSGVQLALKKPGSEEAKRIHMDELVASISPLRFLFGTTAVDFQVEIKGGEIEGEVDISEDHQRLSATIDTLDLRELTIIKDALGLPILGIANGTIDIDLPETIGESKGLIHLEVAGTRIGDGKSKLAIPGMSGGLTVSPIGLGTLEIDVPIEGGSGRIRKLEAKGADAELSGTGSIGLARPAGGSALDLMLRVKFTDAYRTRDDATRKLFAAMDFAPQLQSATTSDGALKFRLSGTLRGSLRATPAGTEKAPGALPF